MNTNNKGLAYVSYLGVFSLIPYFQAKDDEFVQYHAKQGLNLFICEFILILFYNIVINILASFIVSILDGAVLAFLILGFFSVIGFALGILFLVTSIIGMVNVSKGLMKPLPLFGAIQIVK